ncbi:MAG TPA: CoA ester lyase [Nitrososphaerales archaeon]|nr:CoA ester lyase [Nitrososphaerales archaeon]
MQLRRSQLFVPGNDERKIRKALESLPECDSIVFDLEDAVPPAEKASARATIKGTLSKTDLLEKDRRRELCIRINSIESRYFRDDVDLLRTLEMVTCVVVPKAEASAVSELHKLLGEKKLLPLIETARGLLRIDEVVSCEGVVAVAYGAADFANSVGGRVEAYMGNLYVKTKIVVSAKSAGVDPLDNVYFKFSDVEGFRNEASMSRDLGFVGKQVIHPGQIPIANEIYSPSAEEVRRAAEVIRAYEDAQGKKLGALSLNMELVDAVHYRLAKETLAKKDMIDKISHPASGGKGKRED